ncbi:MAG: protein kinase [Verrucomicrobiota bacterium]
MSTMEPDATNQKCPVCGTLVDVTHEDALSRIACPKCGEKFRVERAFDNFVLRETLGVGGMGSVYKARDTRLDRDVALKILRKELSAEPKEAARLEREARAAAAINHPHVIQVFSSGTDHGQFYLVMELVDRGSLDDLMEEHGRLSEEKVLRTGIQSAQGLQAAHAKGLIHRDIKPANILFANEQTAKIGDFGLAVVAEQNAEAQNEIWGTPYYVAPERLDNAPEDFRSDIYSLGATLFHAIAGCPPIEGETNSASALRELKNRPLNLVEVVPGLRRETVRAINRMIAANPAERFGSYDELIGELQDAYNAVTGPGRKSALPKILAALALLAVLGAGGFYFFKHNTEKQSLVIPQNVAVPSPAKIDEKAEARKRGERERERQVAEQKKAADAAREQERQKIHAQELPGWSSALAAYQKQIAAYNFAGALATIKAVPFTDSELQKSQEFTEKKAKWLIQWKEKLIADLNRQGYRVPFVFNNLEYTGISGATEKQLTLAIPNSGAAPVDWTGLPPKFLLPVAKAFIPGSPDAADRQWLCAVFAAETGQTDSAQALATAAANAKPQYRDELGLLVPQTPTPR